MPFWYHIFWINYPVLDEKLLWRCVLCYQNEKKINFGIIKLLHVNESLMYKVKNVIPDFEKMEIWYHKIVEFG